MTTVTIENNNQLHLPAEVQKLVPVGTRLQVALDENGRIILTPQPDIQTILQESFGIWADRTDLPADGVTYVNDLRRGQRLDDFGIGLDETA